MSEPLPIPGVAEHALTERQRQALEIVREHGPLTSEELGARLRRLRGGRESGWQWDTSNGRSLAESLRSKGLVRQVRTEEGMRWVDAAWAPTFTGYDPQTAEIPY